MLSNLLLKRMQKKDIEYRSIASMLKKIYGKHFNVFKVFTDIADNFIKLFSLHWPRLLRIHWITLSSFSHSIEIGVYIQIYVCFIIYPLLLCLLVCLIWCYYYFYVLFLCFVSFSRSSMNLLQMVGEGVKFYKFLILLITVLRIFFKFYTMKDVNR